MVRRPPRRAWLIALLTALVAGAPLVQAAHMASVAHAVCPSHGEIIHVGEAADVPVSHAEAFGSHTPGDDHHDACSVAILISPARAAVGHAAVSIPPAPEQPLLRRGAVASFSSVRILDLAPKTSPPAGLSPS